MKKQYLFGNNELQSILNNYSDLKRLQEIKSIGEFLEEVSNLAAKSYFSITDEEFVRFRQALEKDFPKTLIKQIVIDQNYSNAKPTDPNYDNLLAIGSLKEQIARNIIRACLYNHTNHLPNDKTFKSIQNGGFRTSRSDRAEGQDNSVQSQIRRSSGNLDLTETERIVLLASCDISDQHDVLYRQWLRYTVTGDFAKELRDMGAQKAKEYLQKNEALPEKIPQFMYVVFEKQRDGEIKALSYIEAFPEPTQAMSQYITNLIKQLRNSILNSQKIKHNTFGSRDSGQAGMTNRVEKEAFIAYFTAFRNALVEKVPAKHEELWEKVDIAWMRVSGRLQPIHMMEVYKDSLGLCVDPEYALGFLDDRYEKVNDAMKNTKKNLIEFLKKNYGAKKSLQVSLNPMQASVAGVYAFLISGFRLDFRPSGQNIPNRENVRIKNGVKIFIDMKTMHQRWQVIRKNLIKLFGEDYYHKIFSDEEAIIDTEAGILVPGHEVAHNAFIQEGSREKIGAREYKDIEENKASMSIAVAIPAISEKQKDPYNYKKNFVLNTLADTMLRIAYKDDLAKRPYYHDAVVNISALENSKILQNNHGEWILDLSVEKIDKFFDIETTIYDELVEVYDRTDSDLTHAYIDKYYKPSKIMLSLEEKLAK